MADLPTFFDCLRENRATVIAAHRGGSYPGYAENSIATFNYVLGSAPALMEVDVSRSKDGVLFLFHDERLDKKSNGVGAVAEKSWSELQKLRLVDAAGEITQAGLPTLVEALEWAENRTILQLDVKQPASIIDVVSEVKRAGASSRVIYIAYDIETVAQLWSLDKSAMISITVVVVEDIARVLTTGVDPRHLVAFIGLQQPDHELIDALIQHEIEVIFGTLGGNRSLDMKMVSGEIDLSYRDLSKLNVQVIATDRPIAANKEVGSDSFSTCTADRS